MNSIELLKNLRNVEICYPTDSTKQREAYNEWYYARQAEITHLKMLFEYQRFGYLGHVIGKDRKFRVLVDTPDGDFIIFRVDGSERGIDAGYHHLETERRYQRLHAAKARMKKF